MGRSAPNRIEPDRPEQVARLRPNSRAVFKVEVRRRSAEDQEQCEYRDHVHLPAEKFVGRALVGSQLIGLDDERNSLLALGKPHASGGADRNRQPTRKGRGDDCPENELPEGNGAYSKQS